MATRDIEFHFVSKFNCANPADAAPGKKRHHQLRPVHNAKAPHCAIDMVVGTRGIWVSRTDANQYEGHVPDAPVLLEPGRLEQYRHARAVCDNGWTHVDVIARGAIVGAFAGLAGGGVLAGALALMHLLVPSVAGAVSTALWVRLALCGAFVAALGCAHSDRGDWKQATATFAALEQMAKLAKDVEEGVGGAFPARTRARAVAEHHRLSTEWALQQAAFELDAVAHTPWTEVAYSEAV